MAATSIIIIIALLLHSANAVNYLCLYLRLMRKGLAANADIESIHNSRFIMIKNVRIPMMRFTCADGKSIVGKPGHSWLVELNQYLPKQKRSVYYDSKKPVLFVVKSNTELIMNLAVIIVTAVAIVWFTIHYT